MLELLQEGWRARRVLLLGGGLLSDCAAALLLELGARVARVGAGADASTLCRAMHAGRVCAVLAPQAGALCRGLPARDCLRPLDALLCEAREAGVPLTLLGTDAPLSRPGDGVLPEREDDPPGGRTREGLILSLYELYADAASRALLGDAVGTLRVRHMPCLLCGAPGVAQYRRWCEALLEGEVVCVEHPGRLGAFVHPMDVACGMLLLGASFLRAPSSGLYHLGLSPQCLCANRTAALALAARAGSERPLRETEPPDAPQAPLLDGARAKRLCGAICRMSAQDALADALALLRAEREGRVEAELRAQARRYLEERI